MWIAVGDVASETEIAVVVKVVVVLGHTRLEVIRGAVLIVIINKACCQA